jgi:hypothetical protein
MGARIISASRYLIVVMVPVFPCLPFFRAVRGKTANQRRLVPLCRRQKKRRLHLS